MFLINRLFGDNRPTITHTDTSTINLENIDNGTSLYREGSGLTVITGNVGHHVTISINNQGSLRICGTIGNKCSIYKDGNGTLTIEGAVANDLLLTVYGSGSVIFTQRPHELVIKAMKNMSSVAQISCGGVLMPPTNTGYIHHGLGGARQVPMHQPLIAPPPAANPMRRLSTEPPASSSTTSNNTETDHYTDITQKYIETTREHKCETISVRIAKLKLTSNEEELFEPFIEEITGDYFNDIPIMYDERYYNLSTLLEMYKRNKPDPYSRVPLKLINFQPARTLYNNLDDTIAKLNEIRQKNATTENQITSAPPDAQNRL
ncbi:MAG: hypothetical protein WC627_03405 [Legionella sp.]|jgi:hypothetical protein